MRYFKFIVLVLCISACSSPKKGWVHMNHDYIKPVDTKTKPIRYQSVKTYSIGSVGSTNKFPGARLSNFSILNDSTFRTTISPENTPINESPWYAFKIWSDTPRTIELELYYTDHEHRYNPKLSMDGENWTGLDTSFIELDDNKKHARIKLNLSSDTLWVASQEIQDTKRVGAWVNSFNGNEAVAISEIGKSALGRPLYFMNLSIGNDKKKPTIVILSRQHPPEVTGYFAMQSFVESIIKDGSSNGFLEKYRVLVYPLLNPDGVDLGHYRHNTGGVDLNRDWSEYNQTEIAQVTNHIVNEVALNKNNVLLGLDFHSTYHDVYYTPDESVKRKIPDFTKKWLESIRVELQMDDINEQPGAVTRPTSSGWFNKQFGATGITYEIGDNTPRDFIKRKGEVSAKAMMDYFLNK